MKNMKKCPKDVFDGPKEASWCTECNAKNPSSLQSMDSEKNRNNLQNYTVLTKNTKNGKFWRFFLTFSVTIILKEMGSFALRSVHQNGSFELSNTAFGQSLKLFAIRGDPSDLGGVKNSGKEKMGSKITTKNCFGIIMTKLTHKWVVEVWWTSLGCMAVLYCAVCTAMQNNGN